ncbi:MAG: hypothetical protein JNL67_15120 [Planctomycetaceae bacterium]|nr:hypothetical protein [Planctomycetaceae bacterium]
MDRVIRSAAWITVACCLFLPACAARTKPKPSSEAKPDLSLREFMQQSDDVDDGMGGGAFRFPDN